MLVNVAPLSQHTFIVVGDHHGMDQPARLVGGQPIVAANVAQHVLQLLAGADFIQHVLQSLVRKLLRPGLQEPAVRGDERGQEAPDERWPVRQERGADLAEVLVNGGRLVRELGQQGLAVVPEACKSQCWCDL